MLRDIKFRKYTVQKVSDLQIRYAFLNWKKLFEMVTGKDISDNTLVQVYFDNYFTKLFKELAALNKW